MNPASGLFFVLSVLCLCSAILDTDEHKRTNNLLAAITCALLSALLFAVSKSQ